MKILLVTPYFFPKTGGLENYAYNIAKGLIKKYKWQIVVVTSNQTENKDKTEKLGRMTIYRLAPLFKISNTPINPFWFIQMKKIIKKEKPDLINAHAPVPFIADVAARCSGKIPFVLTYHAGSMKKNMVFLDMLINLYEKLFLHHLFAHAQKIVCSSEFVKYSLNKTFQKKCTVITPGVDTTVFKSSEKQKKIYDVLFVGRHPNVYRLKGFSYLLEAIKQLPTITLTVVGKKVKTEIKNVQFLGLKTPTQLAEIMKKSRLLVLPSIAPMESFGMVLIEAMACKVPVVGTSMGGIPEVIKNNKNGLLVKPRNVDELKKAIEKIVQNKNIAKQMGNEGFSIVLRKYLWQYQIEKTGKVFKNIL